MTAGSFGQPCWSKTSTHSWLPAFRARASAVCPWASRYRTSQPYWWGKQQSIIKQISFPRRFIWNASSTRTSDLGVTLQEVLEFTKSLIVVLVHISVTVSLHYVPLLASVTGNSDMRLRFELTQRRSCVITTSPCWQAACRAEPGSRSAKRDLEERARLRGALMSSLVQWAKRSNSFGRLCSITAKRRRPDSVMSGLSPGVGGGSGATNSFCSYLARIHDSRSSLEMHKGNTEKIVNFQRNTIALYHINNGDWHLVSFFWQCLFTV